MRIVSFLKNGNSALGVRDGDEVIDLSIAAPTLPTELTELLARGPSALATAGACVHYASKEARLPAQELRLLPPTRKASKIICLGLNYIDHAAESGLQRPDYPVVFLRAPTSLVACCEAIVRPNCSEKLDYEGELVAIIGRRARHIERAKALSFVAGYSVFNDASICDFQLRTSQWTVGKNFDRTGAFGPDFVTADEVPPGAVGLRIETRLNGTVVQSATTSDMIFDVAETVALLSECMTLEPGDVLVMGTPAGVGLARTPPLWMKPGDICEVEIEKLGVLRSYVEQEDNV